ncbi:MAG TPA: hypothetical protein VGG43_07155, partial [Acidimicrobiales bacterium]
MSSAALKATDASADVASGQRGFDALEGLIDELIEAGPVSDPESMETLLRLDSKLDAYVTTSVGEFEKW